MEPVFLNSNVPNTPLLPPKYKSRGKHRRFAQKWYHQQQLNFMSTTTHTHSTHEDTNFGNVMGPKADGCMRLGGGNIDTFHTANFNNERGNLLRAFICENELDGFFGQESGLNWDLMPCSGCLNLADQKPHENDCSPQSEPTTVGRHFCCIIWQTDYTGVGNGKGQNWPGSLALDALQRPWQTFCMHHHSLQPKQDNLHKDQNCSLSTSIPLWEPRWLHMPQKGIPTWLWAQTVMMAICWGKTHCLHWHEWRLAQRKNWCYAWLGWAWNGRGCLLHPPWASSSSHLPTRQPLWTPCHQWMLCHPDLRIATQGSLVGNLQMPRWPPHPNCGIQI